MHVIKKTLMVLIIALVGPALVVACGKVNISSDWRNADRSPQGIAPDVKSEQRAVVQAYAARAFSWRGIFAVHTWLAVKPAGASAYTVHQVVGWREWQDLPVVVSHEDAPDRAWYGNAPELLLDIRGEKAGALIPEIAKAVASYPYRDSYTLWPGPNSNSFVAHVAREVPGLRLVLPTTAIGKDYLNGGALVGHAPSGTGWQASLFGVAGITIAREEGLELNILSANFGIEPWPFALKLPGIGRIGF
jgi:hypothetical protein